MVWLVVAAATVFTDAKGLEHLEVTQQKAEYQLTSQVDVRLLTREHLSRFGDQSLAEALARIPGLLLSGPPGKGKDLRLKGLDKGYSQILINGKPAPGNGEKREFDLSSIPLAWVERVEILQAADATVSGAGVGGTLNIVLKDYRASDEVQVVTRRLQNNSWQPALSYSHAFTQDNLRGRLGIDYSETDADKFKDKTSTTAAGVVTTSQENEQRADERGALTADLNYQLSEKTELASQARLIKKQEDKQKSTPTYSKGSLTKTVVETEDKDNRFLWLDNSWSHQLANSRLTGEFGYRDQQEDKDKLNIETDAKGKAKTNAEIEEKREQLRSLSFRWADDLWIVGAEQFWRDRYRLKYKNGVLSGNKDTYDFTENQSALFARYNFKAAGKWSLGLRGERMAREAELNNQFYSTDNTLDWLPNIKYQADLGAGFKYRISGSRSVRWPKFDDMVPFTERKSGTLTDPDKIGNPNLRPEKGWGVDSSVVWQIEQQEIEFYVNRRWVNDLIISSTELDSQSNRYVQAPRNIDNGIASGWGLRFNNELLKDVLIGGSADWQKVEADAVATEFNQVPQMFAKLTVDYRLTEQWQAGAALGYQDEMQKREMTTSQSSLETEAAMTTADIYTNYTFNHGGKLSLSIIGLNNPKKRKSKTTWTNTGALQQQDEEAEYSAREVVLGYSYQF
ncbi:MAG: TonB-dependent receptor [Rheinheimera sp.]|nr:TonB-dependent receptor [Rheinheimera sp.]